MNKQFKELSHFPISHNAKFNSIEFEIGTTHLNDPASKVMTDLDSVIIHTISATDTIHKANITMIAYRIRLLFVLNNFAQLLGLITATDILGEKPIQYLNEHAGTRDDILVQDIMTKKNQLDVLYMSDVNKASVGDIVETIRNINRQHLLVVDHGADTDTLRGIFSTSQISKQLGMEIDLSSRATSFSELKSAIA